MAGLPQVSAAFAVALVLSTLFTDGNAQCFSTTINCQGPSSPLDTVSDCCVGNGITYNDGSGCRVCYVIGYSEASRDLELDEGQSNTLTVEVIKPAPGLPAPQLIVEFQIDNSANTDDVRVGGQSAPTGTVVAGPFGRSVSYTIRAEADQVGQEGEETFTIPLSVTSVGLSDPVFVLGFAMVNITDLSTVVVELTEADYQMKEGQGSDFIVVRVSYSRDIVNPITVRLLPVTYTEFAARGLTLPSGFPSREQGSEFEATVADFDNSIITATLPGPNRQVQVSIPIVDDMIIENQETFVGYIVIAEAIDPGTIELGRSATQLIINDNDICKDNSVRLVGGNDIAGRVEVCYNNVWGTVCDDSLDVSDARVICTQLGIPSQSPVTLTNATFGEGDGPIWLDDLRCNGNESSLQFCPHMGVGESNCDHDEDAGVVCTGDSAVICPPLPDIPNGNVTRTALVVTYTCNSGFELVGSLIRICGNDGTWSGDEPSCQLAPVSVSFDPTAYTVTEGVDATAELMLVRSGDNREVVVSVSTMSGTAIAGDDFTSVAMMVTFSAGQTRASVSVPIIDDILGEISEVFTGSLKAVTGNVVIGADTADVTIINDDNTGDTTDKSSPSDNTAAIIGGVVSVVIAIIIVVFAILVVVLFYCNKTRKRDTHIGSLDEDNSEHEYFTLKQNTTLLQQLQQQLKNKKMIYSKEKLQLSTTVGQGESGLVYKAYLNTALGKELVAVKTVKALFSSSDTERLAKEISTMLLFEHTNIMSLIGVCIEGEMPLLIMPFMSNGSVLEYVKRNKEVLLCSNAMATEETSKTLLGICHQIAKGMEYLSQQKFVHRDLAARNCMIDRKGVIKVADFGLTEDMYGTNYFRRRTSVTGSEEKVPIRWMAPESIKHDIYNEETDVWAFGVTMWEIYTCGRTPYAGIPAMSLLRALENGQRLEKPENTACHEEIYDIMMECWSWNHHERPRFKELVNRLSDTLERDSGYLKLSQPFSLKTKSDELDKHDSALPPVKENEVSYL